MKSLMIVESPTKAKNIKKYLNKNFIIQASFGHILNLPPKKIGINLKSGNFETTYNKIISKKNIIKKITKNSKFANIIYLAPDPDREGEAIAEHIAQIIQQCNKAKKTIYRISFNEITKNAIQDALKNKKTINKKLFQSQHARRILDRIVGYKISPILWKNIKHRLSAGRVQSAALSIITKREIEIFNFKKKKYWNIQLFLKSKNSSIFRAHIYKNNGQKCIIKTLKNTNILKNIIINHKIKIKNINTLKQEIKAAPPFITSKLQQEAAKLFGFSAKKTMFLAQTLYEGIQLKNKIIGLITYMRTDSTRTSKNFLHSLREYIQNKYSISYLSTDPNFFKQKKYIQDSHEAIRPTSLKYNPNYLKKYLNKEQNKIYHLIWNKFLASQMQKSIYNYINIYFQIKNIIFKSKKTFTLFDGFMRIYNNSSKKKQKIFSNSIFKLKKKDIFNLINLKIDLKSTKSKNRFNESNLIKNLEEKEIGRPSTYALIISNIKNKDYIIKNNTKFQSSKLGTLVLKFLNDSFSSITNTKFTALMEEELDKIEHNLKKWILVIKNFYSIFEKETKHSINYMKDLKNLNKKINKFCKKCNFVLFIKFGKNKKFETCFQYSKCQNQKKIQKKEKNIFPVKFKKYQIKCNLCNSEMILRKSKFGKFFGCKRYPKCIKIINFKYLNINL